MLLFFSLSLQVTFTEAEKKRLEAKKRTLQLAREHKALEAKMKQDGYVIPEQYVDEDRGVRNRERQEVIHREKKRIKERKGKERKKSVFGLCTSFPPSPLSRISFRIFSLFLK
jgi:hypothetical protein